MPQLSELQRPKHRLEAGPRIVEKVTEEVLVVDARSRRQMLEEKFVRAIGRRVRCESTNGRIVGE